MPITTTLKPSRSIKLLVLAAVMVAFGIWGVYDWFITYPNKQTNYDRYQVLSQAKGAIETEQSAEATSLNEETRTALKVVLDELNGVLEENRVAAGFTVEDLAEDPDKLNDVVQAAQQGDDAGWLRLLDLTQKGLRSPRTQPLSGIPLQAYDAITGNLDSLGEVEAVNPLDKFFCWMFILCLPCAPYFLWQFIKEKRVMYMLDDDGTLHSPLGAWPSHEVKDIDMSRWMRKSIATVVHDDGTRLDIDDHLYNDAHLIVGSFAHRFYPDQWTAEARQIKGAANGSPPDPAPDDHLVKADADREA